MSKKKAHEKWRRWPSWLRMPSMKAVERKTERVDRESFLTDMREKIAGR